MYNDHKFIGIKLYLLLLKCIPSCRPIIMHILLFFNKIGSCYWSSSIRVKSHQHRLNVKTS